MTAKSFNARNGLSVGTTPTEVVDASGNVTTDTLTATTGNITTLNVSGDLTVSGTTTYINTTTLNVGDNIVTLNADFTTGSPTENAGIEIRRGSSANTALRWNESSDVWEITQDGTNYGRIHSKLTDIVLGTDTSGNYVSAVTSGTTALTVSGTAGEGWSPNLTIRAATTAVDGIVQLTDSVSSTSITTAATPNSVKTAYDVAFGRVSSVDLATTANTVANKGILSITPTTGGGAGTRDDVFFVGSGTTTVSSNASQITISSADQYTGTVTSVGSGNGLTGGAITTTGTLSVVAGNEMVVNASGVHHADITRTNSTTGNTTLGYSGAFDVVDSITTNARGHVTAVNTKRVTLPASDNTNTTYDLAAVANTVANEGRINLTGSDATTDAVKLVGAGTTVLSSNSTQITITSGDQYVGTVTSVASGNGLTGGPITATGTLSVVAGATLVSNATGVHMPNVATAGSSTGGISAVTIDAQGRVTSVTGSAGYVTSSGVTSVATGSGLTGGTITTTGTVSVIANNGIVANSTGVFVNAQSGLTANATGLFVNAGTGLVSNATGVHMATVATAGSSTGGISAVTIDAQGRVTSVTGSAGYVTSSGVTSVASGNGLTGGTITGTGTLSVVAGTGIVSNSSGVHVSLTDSVSSTSTTTAATPNSVKSAYDLAASKGSGTVTSVTGGNGLTGSVSTTGSLAVGAGVGITVNADDVAINAQSGLLANTSGLYVNASSIALGTVPAARLPSGTTGAVGVVQLTDSVSSTSTTTAATPNSVKSAYDLANGKAATNQTMFIGTTSVAINRGSGAISLTGTSIDGSAGSVAWTNVTGRPTNVSSFTNDSGYITSTSQSVNKYAATRYQYVYDYGTRYSPGTGASFTSAGSKNITSFTWNSDGDITINFAITFANANYKAFLQAPGDGLHAYTGIKSQTTTSCRATTKYTANSSGGQFFFNPSSGFHNFVALEFA